MNEKLSVSKIAIYETDEQFDFYSRGGALFVNGQKPWSNKPYGAEARMPNSIAVHKYAAQNGMLILGSVDRHFYEDAELIRNEGGIFDDHCMNGTQGQLRHPELEPQKDIYLNRKQGSHQDIRVYDEAELKKFISSGMHLIFEKQSYDVNTNPNFQNTMKLLMENGLEKIAFKGFATDYCIPAALLATAKYRDMYNPGLEIYLINDAIEEVNIDFEGKIDMDFGKKAIEKMVQAGAKEITTKQVLEGRL